MGVYPDGGGVNQPLLMDVSDAPGPEELFADLADEPWVLWLDTALAEAAGRGRFSFLAVDPFRVLRGRAGQSEWVESGRMIAAPNDPISELGRAMERYRLASQESLPPFCGGAGGLFGYELAGDLEVIPAAAHRDIRSPDLEVGLYDLVIGWDRVENRCWIASTGFPDTDVAGRHKATRRLEQARAWLSGGRPPSEHRIPGGTALNLARTESPRTFPVPGAPGVRSTFSPPDYRRAVRRAIDWIHRGDIFQVNLSQRFEARSSVSASRLYLRLRAASPAPFGSFYRGDQIAILSTSPERFLHVTPTGHVQTRPIKGTRRRSKDRELDMLLATELASSAKDRAENLMIVDLLRNDLSRVCRADSVRAVELFRLESYSNVHHLVSTVEGDLLEGRDCTDILRATFPSGSVTGAPKIRAMEIISELEPVARGPYCGALGYLGFGGDMDTSVSIRIAVVAEERIVFHAGGAIVADSDPAAEYEETLDKVQALISAITVIEP
jgi:para-aminobenzoate synthetase component 1